jgi:hypothetical protein
MVVAVLLAGVGGVVAAAGPANAETRDGTCNNGEICLWKGIDWTDERFDAAGYAGDYTQWRYSGGCSVWNPCDIIDNSVSSDINKDVGKYVYLTENSFGGGLTYSETPGGSAQNLTIDKDSSGKAWNDRFSSHCFVWSGAPSWC